MVWEPSREGIDHINIYSKSSLTLGRALSNFFHSVFIHPKYGKFNSVEGYYYWWLTGRMHDELKELHGFKAKEFGESKEAVIKVTKKFKEEMQYAVGLKVLQNEYIQNLMIKSSLPFAHYYYYGKPNLNPKVYDRSKKDDYLIDACETLRAELKRNGKFDKVELKLIQ